MAHFDWKQIVRTRQALQQQVKAEDIVSLKRNLDEYLKR